MPARRPRPRAPVFGLPFRLLKIKLLPNAIGELRYYERGILGNGMALGVAAITAAL